MGRGGGSSSSRSSGSRSHSSSSRGSHSSHGSRASFSSGRSRGYGGSSHSSSSSSYKRGPSHDVPPRRVAQRTHGLGFGGFGFPGGHNGGFIGYGNGAPRRSHAGGGGCGCLAGLAGLMAALVALVLFLPTSCMGFLSGRKTSTQTTSPTQVTQVTQQLARTRDPLEAGACIESDQWIDDQAGWLEDQQVVIDAMRSFYEQTGVQPYLVIADEIDGNKDYATGDAEQFLRNRYDELYDDDGHLILLFCEPYENEYDPYLLVGTAAQEVVDTDGENIIYDAIAHWYTDTSLNDDAYFARIFVASANALMYGTSFDEFG